MRVIRAAIVHNEVQGSNFDLKHESNRLVNWFHLKRLLNRMLLLEITTWCTELICSFPSCTWMKWLRSWYTNALLTDQAAKSLMSRLTARCCVKSNCWTLNGLITSHNYRSGTGFLSVRFSGYYFSLLIPFHCLSALCLFWSLEFEGRGMIVCCDASHECENVLLWWCAVIRTLFFWLEKILSACVFQLIIQSFLFWSNDCISLSLRICFFIIKLILLLWFRNLHSHPLRLNFLWAEKDVTCMFPDNFRPAKRDEISLSLSL